MVSPPECPIVCKECRQFFSNNSNLKRHVLLKHDASNAVTCAHCSREFAEKRYLAVHMKTHFSRIKLTCDECGRHFTNRYSLARHVARHGSSSTLTCADCYRQFSSKSNLVRHLKMHSSPLPSVKADKCPLCDVTGRKSQLLVHFRSDHGIVLSKESLTFPDFESFESWKTDEEKNEKCCFVSKSLQRNKDGSMRKLFICHRSGYFGTKGKGKRHLKAKGSNKINGFCPSHLDVIKTPAGVTTVHYEKTHVGHSAEVDRLTLSLKDRQIIAEKIASRVPFGSILDDARGYGEDSFSRIHLLTKKDLYNIKQCFKIKTDEKKDKEDFIGLQSWISDMSRTSNIVRLHKPKGGVSLDFPELSPDVFLLVLANDAQLESLERHGGGCVCVDETPQLDPSAFHLTTLVVIDEFNQGIPGAFLLSNKRDESVFAVFFRTIQNCVNSRLFPSVFMGDTAFSLYNAWKTVMPLPKMTLFCSWLVDRDWSDHLKAIQDSEKRASTYKLLRTLLEERDEFEFNNSLDETIKFMKSDPDVYSFAQYFEDNYKLNTSAWAYCYRQYAGLNADVGLERLFKTIKGIYSSNKKRLDKTAQALMKFASDKLCDRSNSVRKMSSLIKRRHAASLNLNPPIRKGDKWTIQSSKSSKILFEMTSNHHANCECELKCVDCDICSLAFSCSCPENSLRWVMCAHIHALARHLKDTVDQLNEPLPIPSEAVIVESVVESESTPLIIYVQEPSFEDMKSTVLNQFMTVLGLAETVDHLNLISKSLNFVSASIAAKG